MLKLQNSPCRRLALCAAAACLALVCLLAGCGAQERTSEDGAFRYRVVNGAEAVITGCELDGVNLNIPFGMDACLVTGIEDGAIPDGTVALTLPDGVEVSEGALSECTTLRYALLPAGLEVAGLPEGCRVLRSGEAYGESILTGIHADESGALFGLLDEGSEAVLLSVPAGVSSYEVPEAVGVSLVTRMDAAALDEAADLETLVLHENISFPPEMFPALQAIPELTYPEDSLLADYILTVDAANRINEQRAAAGIDLRIEPDMDIIRAARVRMEELGESYSSARPDSSDGKTALAEAGVEYHFAQHYHWHGASVEEMYEELLASILTHETDPEAVLLNERIGLSAGCGPYSEEEDYVSYAFLTNATQTELNDGNIQYEYRDGMLMPVSLNQNGPAWIHLYGSLYGAQVGDLPEGFFDGNPNLRAVMLTEDSPHEDQIPDGIAVVRRGEDTGDGLAETIYINDYRGGMVYVGTDRDRCVLWDIPRGLDSTALQPSMGGLPVTYISRNAIAYNRSTLEMLVIPFDCGFAPSMSGIMSEIYVSFYKEQDGEPYLVDYEDADYFNALYFSLEFTNELVAAVNELREESGLERMSATSYELTRAAWTLAKEQADTFGTTRPDGESWTTALSEEYVDWSNGYIWLQKYDQDNIDEFEAEVIAEVFAPARDDGSLFDTAAMGVYMTEDLTLYVCALGILS